MKYKNGDEYEGEWVNDNQFQGIMKYNNGDIYNGTYKNNKREGKGIMEYYIGNKFEGNWINDKREGKGKIIYEKNRKEDIFEGIFVMIKLKEKGFFILKTKIN